ncbi:hypothetical protein BDR26DRAFT_936516 [Obelidium mucronatum]|nr:hypothetical protein BDR26DRAFT_936516 [Obelidium mucronatum]
MNNHAHIMQNRNEALANSKQIHALALINPSDAGSTAAAALGPLKTTASVVTGEPTGLSIVGRAGLLSSENIPSPSIPRPRIVKILRGEIFPLDQTRIDQDDPFCNDVEIAQLRLLPANISAAIKSKRKKLQRSNDILIKLRPISLVADQYDFETRSTTDINVISTNPNKTMLAAYGPPKESNKLTKTNYTTYFRKWYQVIKKVLGNIGLPAGSALYQVTANPDTVPFNSLVMFMTVPVTHVSKAKIYGFEPLVEGSVVRTVKTPTFDQEMRFNGIVSNFETAKSRSSAGIQDNIVTGLNALQSHCLVCRKEYPPVIAFIFKQASSLPLAVNTNTALCAEFEANNIENFFIGLKDDELARSMKALIFSKAKTVPMNFIEVLAIVSEEELGSRGRIVHKELFGTGVRKSFVATAENSLESQVNMIVSKALAAMNPNSVSDNRPKTKDPHKLFVVGFPHGTTSESLQRHFQGSKRVNLAKSANGSPIAFVLFDSHIATTNGLNTCVDFGMSKLVIHRAFNKAIQSYKLSDSTPIINHAMGYLDSGSQKHLTYSAALLNNMLKCKPSSVQGIVSGAVLHGSGIQGDVKIKESNLTLKGVEHIPNSTKNLVSIWKL